MAKKTPAKAQQPTGTAAGTTPAAADSLQTREPLPATPAPKVNNANLAELKHALDDYVQAYFSRAHHPGFTRSFRHDDTRLALGWTSVAVAAATGYYGYRTDFHQSTFWVSVGVAIYVILNTLLALYVAFVERNTIFEGKRRTLASRILTERLAISSLAAASPRTFTSSSWVPFPLSLLVPAPHLPPPSSSSSSSSTTPAKDANPAAQYPLYALTLSYAHSSSAGKALLHRASVQLVRPCAELFDHQGRLAQSEMDRWLAEGLAAVQREGGPGTTSAGESGPESSRA